jgi:phospholipid/cholesterol/gamma-HCH transport system substrate-binding protein
METRASHVLIGTFMLLMVAALFGFIVWLARLDQSSSKEYDIFFSGGVTGLSNGAAVQFNGVPIGQVKKIALVKNDPGLVRVRIRVDDETPILQGTTAILDSQGLTGISFVQLKGGYRGQPPIEKKEGQDVPVIPAQPSALMSLFTNAPQVLEQASVAITRIGQLLNEDNRKNIGATLKNLNTVSAGIANRTPDIERAIASLDGTMAELRSTSQAVRALAETTNQTMSAELPGTMQDIRGVAKRMQQTADNLDAAVSDTRPGLASFSDTTVPELNRLIVDLRSLSRSLQTTSEKFEGGLGPALFGNKVSEYEPATK